jgi:hypothetical protein
MKKTINRWCEYQNTSKNERLNPTCQSAVQWPSHYLYLIISMDDVTIKKRQMMIINPVIPAIVVKRTSDSLYPGPGTGLRPEGSVLTTFVDSPLTLISQLVTNLL